MRTKVVNKSQEPYDVYIGRGSIFGNPFEIGRDGTREQVIERYKEWFAFLTRDEAFVDALLRLEGKRLGCFCKPLPCHGEVIVEWLKWYRESEALYAKVELEPMDEDPNPDEGAAAENAFHDEHGTCSCHAGEVEMQRELTSFRIGAETNKAVAEVTEETKAKYEQAMEDAKRAQLPATYDPMDCL